LAPSDQAFRRHLINHHDERLVVRRRGPQPYETFIRLSARESYERRTALANRQGGRGNYRRELIGNIRSGTDPLAPSTVTRSAQVNRVRVGADSADETQPQFSVPTRPSGGYLPAGYRSALSESSLSEGEFSERDRSLSDELNELEHYPRVYQELHDPDVTGSLDIADRDSDSDWDVVSPDVVMPPPGAANNRPLHSPQRPAVLYTMHDEETLTEQTVSVDTGTDARPATPPPVRYDAWTETVQRRTVNVSTNTLHIPII